MRDWVCDCVRDDARECVCDWVRDCARDCASDCVCDWVRDCVRATVRATVFATVCDFEYLGSRLQCDGDDLVDVRHCMDFARLHLAR